MNTFEANITFTINPASMGEGWGNPTTAGLAFADYMVKSARKELTDAEGNIAVEDVTKLSFSTRIDLTNDVEVRIIYHDGDEDALIEAATLRDVLERAMNRDWRTAQFLDFLFAEYA